MKALRRVFVMMLALPALTYGQDNNFDKIRYIGGAVQARVESDDWGNSLAVTSEGIKLVLKDGQRILIDPKRVTGLSYGQEAHRRVGTEIDTGFILPGAVFDLFRDTRMHYISIEFTTPEERKSAILIQAHRDNYRAVLTALRGATGVPLAVSEGDRKLVPVGDENVSAKKEVGKQPEGDAAAPAEGATGAVRVASQPEGADIWVDGALVGIAPAQLKLAIGKRRILVLKEGYRNWEKVITVISGLELTINAQLKK